MKFLKSWIQDHIDVELPKEEVITDVLSKKSLEVEEIINLESDAVFDIKVLPHRQHDCFSHRGIARELCTLFSLKEKEIIFPSVVYGSADILVNVEDSKLCPRYIGVKVENVKVENSPTWLKDKLEKIGQRSISNIVDITNFVMNDIGQPMHAFDADKVVGGITVRVAKEGEKMVTLDSKELTMRGTETVIADDEGVLALAGVKGGKKALVDENTKAIIFESANFNSTATRKSSDYHNIKTDASKRYEAGMTSEYAGEAMDMACALIKEMIPGSEIGKKIDVYEKKEKNYKVGVSLNEINNLLGSNYEEKDVIGILEKERCVVSAIEDSRSVIKEKALSCVSVPYKRGASVLYDAPNMFDCSSLVSWLMIKAGYFIPRVTIDQFVYSREIKENDLQIGDLVFTNTKEEISKDGEYFSKVLNMNIKEAPIRTETLEFIPGTKVPHGIDHVAIYVGSGEIVHTSKTIGTCVVEKLSDSKQFKNDVYFRRVINDEKRFKVSIPFDRLDLRIKEDLIEEIGRVMGYDDLPSVLPVLSRKGKLHKRLYYESKIKNILLENGFSEIYTYTFGDKGEVGIVKGLAGDKEKLRTNLGDGVLRAVQMNILNAPLLGIDTVKVFEFGNVFLTNSERRNFAIAIDDGKKKTSFSEEVDLILSQIKRELKVEHLDYSTVSSKPYVIEIDFDKLIEELEEQKSYEAMVQIQDEITYKSVIQYPFIVRDIACWTPHGTSFDEITDTAINLQNPLIVRVDKFDEFTKEIDGVKKTSYAFRIVLQSKDKTLTDEEANVVANNIYNLLKEKGFEIR